MFVGKPRINYIFWKKKRKRKNQADIMLNKACMDSLSFTLHEIEVPPKNSDSDFSFAVEILLTIISPCSVQEQRVLSSSAKIEDPGVLNKVLYEEAPPPRSNSLPFYIPFLTEKVPLRYTFYRQWYPFRCLVQNFASLLTAVNALSLKYE